MENDIYRNLQQKLNQNDPIGFPASKSGVELKILKRLFSEEDADLYIKMAPQPETAEMIAGRIGEDTNKTSERLKRMLENGTVMCFDKEGQTVYSPVTYQAGLYENAANNKKMDAALAEFFEQYHKEAYFEQMAKRIEHLTNAKNQIFKYVPVHEAVKSFTRVFPHDDAVELLKRKKKIAVIDCACRKQLKLIGKTTRPIETCFFFDDHADYFVGKRKQGRYLSLGEAIEIQKQCEEAGLVTTGGLLKDEILMCHCDRDCVAFRSFGKIINSNCILSNYYAQVDVDLCTGCGECIGRCITETICISEGGIAEVNLDRCIGCGQCVTACPTGAMSLKQKPEEEQFRDLLSMEEFVQRIFGN